MATWIKATDRLPGAGKFVRMKFDDAETEWRGEMLDELNSMTPEFYDKLLWLDESQSPAPSPSLQEAAEKYAKDNCRSCQGAFLPCICDNLKKSFLAGAELLSQQPLQGEKSGQPIWQLCPKCNGQGQVSKPPYIPGDVNEWSSSATSFVCDVCNGAKILTTPLPLNKEGNVDQKTYLDVLRENLEASKQIQDKSRRKLLIETYEDLIAIWEANYAGKIWHPDTTEGNADVLRANANLITS